MRIPMIRFAVSTQYRHVTDRRPDTVRFVRLCVSRWENVWSALAATCNSLADFLLLWSQCWDTLCSYTGNKYMSLLFSDTCSPMCKLYGEYFCSSWKFEILVRWYSSQQNSFPNSYYKMNKCLVSYHMLRFTSAIRRNFFYISCLLKK